MGADYRPGFKAPAYQAPHFLNQPNPVQDQWYELMHEFNAIIYRVKAHVALVGETLEVRATVDGQVIAGLGFACAADAAHIAFLFPNPITGDDFIYLQASTGAVDRAVPAFLIMGRDILIEVRKTTAAGAGNLTASDMWGQYG